MTTTIGNLETLVASLIAKQQELTVEVRTMRREVRHLALLVEACNQGKLAPDHDLSDHEIKFEPKQRAYHGPSYKGKLCSQATPEFLDFYASSMQHIAEISRQERRMYNGKPQWMYDFTRAAQARRWAYRLRTGWTPPEKGNSPFAEEVPMPTRSRYDSKPADDGDDGDGENDIPF